MTESEARQKWCPFVRFNETGANRWTFVDEPDGEYAENPDFARCIGSKCMAWREYGVVSPQYPNRSVTHGYCGLAGKP